MIDTEAGLNHVRDLVTHVMTTVALALAVAGAAMLLVAVLGEIITGDFPGRMLAPIAGCFAASVILWRRGTELPRPPKT